MTGNKLPDIIRGHFLPKPSDPSLHIKAVSEHCVREMKDTSQTFLPIQDWELREARTDMKDGKKGSADGVAVQDIKLMNEESCKVAIHLFNEKCSPQGKPNEWTDIRTWLIPKKEGTEKVCELRPVACLSHLYQLM